MFHLDILLCSQPSAAKRQLQLPSNNPAKLNSGFDPSALQPHRGTAPAECFTKGQDLPCPPYSLKHCTHACPGLLSVYGGRLKIQMSLFLYPSFRVFALESIWYLHNVCYLLDFHKNWEGTLEGLSLWKKVLDALFQHTAPLLLSSLKGLF